MRISDWSSDVCSSDLARRQKAANLGGKIAMPGGVDAALVGERQEILLAAEGPGMHLQPGGMRVMNQTRRLAPRSEPAAREGHILVRADAVGRGGTRLQPLRHPPPGLAARGGGGRPIP